MKYFTGFPWQYYSNNARRREYKQILYEKLREWIEESGDKKKIFISNLLTEADWDIAGALMHISMRSYSKRCQGMHAGRQGHYHSRGYGVGTSKRAQRVM